MQAPYIPTTICAIATPSGTGGIAIIRLSGAQSLEFIDKLFTSYKGGKPLSAYAPRLAVYGRLQEGDSLIDEVVALRYQAPYSYTGEDVVEIQCHGSVYVAQTILSALLRQGATMAMPGEFSQRAYLNGKMNLSEAEAVADIIHAETESQHRMALMQLRGGYSQELNALTDELLKLTALMELELDFSEEDVEFADRTELLTLLRTLEEKIHSLTESFRLGNAIKRGIPVAIVGPTNAGKSTLLNTLLGEERAIVSDIHGTTRDSIEETLNIGGYLFRFIDTAGIRQTSDEIEAIGIERSLRKLQEATICLHVLDGNRLQETQELKDALTLMSQYPQVRSLLVINKSDLMPIDELTAYLRQQTEDASPASPCPFISISAAQGLGIAELKTRLIELAQLPEHQEGDIVVSNSRHQHLLSLSLEALQRVGLGLRDGLPTDLLTPDLRQAILHIGEITGQAITSDQVLHHIFQHFCIGK